MPVISELKQEISGAETLRYITNTFKEISAIKIKDLRHAFESNKLFFEEIIEVYHVLKLSAARLKLKMLKKKAAEAEKRRLAGSLKTLSIAVTSNRRFYGRINFNVIREFVDKTAAGKTDRLIIGRRGVEYLRALIEAGSAPPLIFKTFYFQKDFPKSSEVDTLIDITKYYDSVLLYYPMFITVFIQKVGVLDITQTPSLEELGIEQEVNFISSWRETNSFIFEPELLKILDFFEKQMRFLLFKRAMLEAELSRTAARLMSMSIADERAEAVIKEKKFALDKAEKSLTNARLLETFVGVRRR